MTRVVVTGLGCVTPIGNSVETFAHGLYLGPSGIAPFDPTFPGMLAADPGLRFRTSAQVKDFDAAQHLSTGILASTDRGAQFALVAARQATAESELLDHHDPARIAILTGCACGGRNAEEDANRGLYTQNARVHPMSIVRTMSSGGASNIAIDLRITGTVLNIATACASGTHAIGLAFQMVRAGIADAALAGGHDAPLTFGFLRAWDSMRVVSPSACRPFAADRDGMTLGEGAAMLAIEPLPAALARNAHIYAEILGFGATADAHHITQPQAQGAAEAMRRALDDIAVGTSAASFASQVGYINAHGTGTVTNDAVEADAIHRVFGALAPRIPVGATKSLTGHSIGAAGAIEALATALALDRGMLPPTFGVTEVDPRLNLDVLTSARPIASDTPIALSNSLAFGGLNAVLALRHYP